MTPEDNNKKTAKMGFEETKQAIDLAIALGTGIEKSLKDDKITVSDIPNFFPAFMAIFDAIEGAEEIPMEFAIATPEEIAELKSYVHSHLDLEDDKLEGFIEDSFKVLLDIYVIYTAYFAKREPLSDSQDQVTPE